MDKSADWIEEYLAKLRAKVIDTIVEITNQTDPVKEIQLQFQNLLEMLSVVVQDIISEVFPKLEGQKTMFLNEARKLDATLQKLEKDYKKARGDLERTITVLDSMKEVEKELNEQLKFTPVMPEVKINPAVLEEGVRKALKVQYRAEVSMNKERKEAQAKEEVEEEEEEEEKVMLVGNQNLLMQPIRGSTQIKIFDLQKKMTYVKQVLVKFPQEFAICQTNGIVWLSGGCLRGAKSVSDLWRVSNGGNRVEESLAPMIRCRSRHALCGSAYRLMASGDVGCLPHAEMYKIRQDRWGPIPDLTRGRREHAALTVDEKFFVFGGYSSKGVEHSCERWFEGERRWQYLKTRFQNIYHFTAICPEGDKILVFGTDGKDSYMTEFNQDILSYEETKCMGPAMPTCSETCLAASNGRVYGFRNDRKMEISMWTGARWQQL